MRQTCFLVLPAFVFFVQPAPAFSQALPWQTDQQQQTMPQSQDAQSGQHHHKGKGNGNSTQTPQSAPAAQNSQREQDDHHLNELGTQFYNISSKDKQAIVKLKKLQQDVKVFNASLDNRTYNASDIAKDTDNLERRITTQLKKLEAKASAANSAPKAALAQPVTPPPATLAAPAPAAPETSK
jgi:hypothetical protein